MFHCANSDWVNHNSMLIGPKSLNSILLLKWGLCLAKAWFIWAFCPSWAKNGSNLIYAQNIKSNPMVSGWAAHRPNVSCKL